MNVDFEGCFFDHFRSRLHIQTSSVFGDSLICAICAMFEEQAALLSPVSCVTPGDSQFRKAMPFIRKRASTKHPTCSRSVGVLHRLGMYIDHDLLPSANLTALARTRPSELLDAIHGDGDECMRLRSEILRNLASCNETISCPAFCTALTSLSRICATAVNENGGNFVCPSPNEFDAVLCHDALSQLVPSPDGMLHVGCLRSYFSSLNRAEAAPARAKPVEFIAHEDQIVGCLFMTALQSPDSVDEEKRAPGEGSAVQKQIHALAISYGCSLSSETLPRANIFRAKGGLLQIFGRRHFDAQWTHPTRELIAELRVAHGRVTWSMLHE